MGNGLDGFVFNASLVDQSGRWPWLAVSRLRQLVEGPAWRPRWYPVPLDGAPVAALSDHLEQLFIRPGSLLYGVSFVALDGSPTSELLLQISFDDQKTTLFSKPQLASAFTPGGAFRPVLLSEPKLLTGPAVSCRIFNTAAVDRSYQLLLCCAEPWRGNGE